VKSKETTPNQVVGRQGIGYKTKDSTRTDLAACAARFFAKQGYYGTSTQAIAESCNIRKASLFHHYKTKEDIAIAALDYVHKECINHIFKHTENNQVDKKERLHNFLQASEQFFMEHEYSLLPVLLGLELGDINLFKQSIEDYFNAWHDALTKLLLPLCNDESSAQQLAQKSMMCIQGHVVSARIQKDQKTLANLSPALRQLWSDSPEFAS
jgi:AcrR family transcriptional regulator